MNQSQQTKKPLLSRLVIRTVLLIAAIVLLDLLIGNLLRTLYFRQSSGEGFRTTYSIEKTKADLLIFGSSTATHDYIPKVFEDQLGVSTYNAGRDGVSIFYEYAVLEAVLKRYKPHIVLLDLDKKEFSIETDSYDRLACLLPYYKAHPEMRNIIEMKSHCEKWKLLSQIYPFNSAVLAIAAGNAKFNKTRQGDLNGYLPLEGRWADPIRDGSTFPTFEIDTVKVHVYEDFIKACQAADVKLYIICSPVFIQPNYADNSLDLGKEIARKYNVPFFDHLKDPTFLIDNNLFADISHLNDKGAYVYSNLLCQRILAERKGDTTFRAAADIR